MEKFGEIIRDGEDFVLQYEDLDITIITHVYPATRWEEADEDGYEDQVDWDYTVKKEEVYEYLCEYLPSELYDFSDKEKDKYIDEHLDELLEDAKKDIYESYLEKAQKAAEDWYQEKFNEGPDKSDYGY